MLISSLLIGAGVALAAPLQRRWNFPKGQCVTDIKVEVCHDFDCQIDGYKRIDAFLNQAENVTQWNYLFYKTEEYLSEGCITKIQVAEEGEAGPDGGHWQKLSHCAHEGVTEGGGPSIWVARESDAQYAGKVVDQLILKGGRWKNKTEDYIRSPVNLGLGAGAGEVEFESFREGNAVSSGWLHLDYTLGGIRPSITDVKVIPCSGESVGAECGADLIAEGWERRDVDLNGPTANGSHIYIFTTTEPNGAAECVGRLALVNSTDLYADETIDVNVNEGTSGPERYLRVIRSQDLVPGSCLTSIIPLDLGYYTPKAHYEPVRDDDGSPANFNAGVEGADQVFVYTSTFTGEEEKEEIKLSFNETGQFKIALFSDLHYGNQDLVCQDVPDLIAGNCTSRFTYRFMSRTLDAVKPDLVIINGDVFADGARAADGQRYEMQTAGAIIKAVEPIIERGLPFATTFGNHDPEGDLTREEIQRILDSQPGYVGSRGLAELEGIGNYHLDISKGDSNDGAHKLWFFNSGSYLFYPNNGTAAGPYGKVGHKQIEWYKNNAGDDKAIAFFHIPLGEIGPLSGLNSSALEGTKGETICPQGQGCTDEPDLNDPFVGLFEAFLEKGEVKAAFSGHDHVNDYTIDVQGITLGYDGSAGYNAYGAGDINYNRQMRVIEIGQWGNVAETYKVIDDLAEGTVHRNASEPIVTLF